MFKRLTLGAAILCLTAAAPAPLGAGAGGAMARFVAAMRAKDGVALARLFPRTGAWRLRGTMASGAVEAVPGVRTRGDLAKGGNWRDMLVGGDDDDQSFRDTFVTTRFAPWVADGKASFVPPGRAYRGTGTRISWRVENGAWVVAEIAMPAS